MELDNQKPLEVAKEEQEDFGIMAAPCEVEVAIDSIALVLGIVGVPGKFAEKVAKKLFNKLSSSKRRQVSAMLRKLGNDPKAAPGIIVDIFMLLVTTISFGVIKDSLNDLSWWDYFLVLANFTAIFASGGAALVVKVAFMTNDVVNLTRDSLKCFN